MSNLKKYFVVRASGGLSNRLQAVLAGIAYCLLTGRTLCVDWRDGLYSDDFSNVFPLWFSLQHIDIASCEDVLEAYDTGAEVSPSFWKENLRECIAVEYLFNNNEHMSSHHQTAYNLTQEQLLEKDNKAPAILVYWGWDLQGVNALLTLLQKKFPLYSGLDSLEIQRALLQKHLQPTQSIQQEVRSFYTKHFGSAPLGLHIRHSDLQSPLPQMLATLQEIYRQGDEIFLCTDNAFVEKMVQRLYPHCTVREKTFQGVNVPLHCYVEGISNVQKGFDAVVEMLLLSHCKHIIYYAPSSFSRISILYSQLDSQHIHAVPQQMQKA